MQNVIDDDTAAQSLFDVEKKTLAVNTRLDNQHSDSGRFIFTEGGVVAVITEQGRYLVPPQQVIWLPSAVNYQLVAATSAVIVCYHLLPQTQYKLKQTTSVLGIDGFILHLFKETLESQEMHYGAKDFYHLSHLLLNRLTQAKPLSLFLPVLKDKRLLAITRRQQKYPALKTDLVGWGKFVKTSSRTLSRLFKNETGMTYSQWKQTMLIHIAIIELCLGVSIADIAKSLGYESSSAFIYMFKKQMHVTPSHFLLD